MDQAAHSWSGCTVTKYLLSGEAGAAGALMYTGEAQRREADSEGAQSELVGAQFTVRPHGVGTMTLVGKHTAQRTPPPSPAANPEDRPQRKLSGLDGDSGATSETYDAVKFTGTFVEGLRTGWGSLEVVRVSGATRASTVGTATTVGCRWDKDVPQLLCDPCTVVEHEERAKDTRGRRVRAVYCGLIAMASQDLGPRGFSGLAWALGTRFLADTLGERIDMASGTRYCGEWQCGQRHGFGVVTALSGHSLIYCGLFDNDARHGAGTSVDEVRHLTFDGVWADDGIASGGGTLHLPPSALAIQGQKWASATSVATGFLVKARGSQTGMWEPLLFAFDEALPVLANDLESIGIEQSSPALALSPNSSPASPIDSPAVAEFNQAEYDRAVVLASVVSALRPAREALDRVRFTAFHATALPVVRRALATFQRCMLFLFGSCGYAPVRECGAGSNPESPGTLATSWCRLCGKFSPGFTCAHRTRGGRPVTLDVLERAIQASSSMAMSLRLRLMTCHGAVSSPTVTAPNPSPGRSDADGRRDDGTLSAGAATEHEMTTTDARRNSTCAFCALEDLLDLGIPSSALDTTWKPIVDSTLSTAPLRSASSQLANSTWDAVAATCLPLLLSLSEAVGSNSCGAYRTAIQRIGIAVSRRARSEAIEPIEAAARLFASADLRRSIASGTTVDSVRAAMHRAVHVLFGSLSAPSSRTTACPLAAAMAEVQSAAATFLAPALAADVPPTRPESTDVGPLFVYGGSATSRAGSHTSGIISRCTSSLLRMVLLCRVAATALLGAASDFERGSRVAATLLRFALFSLGPKPAVVPWLAFLHRGSANPTTVMTSCHCSVHDADGVVAGTDDSDSADAQAREFALPASHASTAAVATIDFSPLGAWGIATCTVACMSTTDAHVTGADPATGECVAEVLRLLSRFFERHLVVPTRRFSSIDAPPQHQRVWRIVPSVRDVSEGLECAETHIEALLAAADHTDESRRGRALEVEDYVLLRVADWCFISLAERSLEDRTYSTSIPLRITQPASTAPLDDDDDDDQARGDASSSPLEGVVRECYTHDTALRADRLLPLVQLLAHIGVTLRVADEHDPAVECFGSPGLTLDARDVLQLRLHAAADASRASGDSRNMTDITARRAGTLQLPPLALDRVLVHWRRLRMRVETTT